MPKIVFQIIFCVGIFYSTFSLAHGAELIVDTQEIVKAQVLEIVSTETRELPGLSVNAVIQDIRVEIKEGEKKGEIVQFNNDYTELEEGDLFYLRRTIEMEGTEYYSVADPYRLPALFALFLIFIVLTVSLGGIQGVRGLLALGGSFFLIIYALLPGIVMGFNPVIVSIVVASLIIVLGSYVTHGFNRTTTTAVIGMILTVVLTGILGFIAMRFAKLTGYDSDEVIYFALNMKGEVDIMGILFSGIMIGLLGVLYDSAIGQSIAVEELMRASTGRFDKLTIYKRAIRIGREHIGALVNTLAIAYVGASLPLLLLFYGSSVSLWVNLNSEVIATEVVRTLVGSIGLVLAVPITTWIAVSMLYGRKFDKEHNHHHHHHSN